MPRYFFDIVDGEDLPDEHGSEHADLIAARHEAIRYSGEVLREMPDRFWNSEEWKMTVSDAKRLPLFELKFIATPLTAPSTPIRSLADASE
ncbi:MAG: hypothetical protein ABI240_07030 [Sphingomonas sp.]